MPNGGKTNVLILGGGVAGTTAAYQLSNVKNAAGEAAFDVTLLTLGWRLGGKGASGRNEPRGRRIEEHGLHVWFGFYDNAFRMMRRAYGELGRTPDKPLRTVEQAFKPCDDIILWEEWKGRWIARMIHPPRNRRLPGARVRFWHPASVALDWLWPHGDAVVQRFQPQAEKAGLFEPSPLAPHAIEVLTRIGIEGIEDRRSNHDLLYLSQRLAEQRALNPELSAPRLSHERLLSRMLTALQAPWNHLFNMAMDDDDLRFAYMALNFAGAMTYGLVHEVLPYRSFDRLDDEEWSHWLRRNGVSQFTLDHAPWIKAYYDLTFGFEEGDWRRRNMAAGVANKDLLRMGFNYKGAMMWKMQAGMGDVVFAPLYMALEKRANAHVRFFQRVRSLELTADKSQVERVWVQPQARLHAAGYAPLDVLGGLDYWPNEPDWDQLVGGDALREELRQLDTTLEDESFDSGLPGEELVLGQDFDYVVLAISVESLRNGICAELADDTGNPNFGRMLDNSYTVMTQAFQLWLIRSLKELGWRDQWGDDPVSSAFVEPFDTCSAMDQLLTRESMKSALGEPAKHIAYFCGPLPHADAPDRQTANASARKYALDHIVKYLRVFWPKAYPGGQFNWDLLCDHRLNAVGPARFDSQYWRANYAGSERYVSTRAGTVKYRLKSDQSGYDNLLLAGDWTRNGIDGGCVEAAVISGMLAAYALSGVGRPLLDNVYPLGGG